LLIQAHTSAIQSATQLQQHLNECNQRDQRNERMFGDTKQNIVKLFEKIEANKTSLEDSLGKVSDDVNSSNKWIYMIVGGITLAGALLDKVPIAKLLSGQ
jgi:hypothetical protein